jgi:hypothetical protein
LRAQYPSLALKGTTTLALFKANGERGEARALIVLEAPRNGQPRLFYFDESSGRLLRTEERNQAVN